MLKVYGERYVNDWNRRDVVYEFAGLDELEEWLFDQSDDMYFSVYKKGRYPVYKDLPFAITVSLNHDVILRIHRIDSEDGIIFSDGVRTKGKKHWSKKVEVWCKHCDERWSNPTFTFAD